MDRSLVRFGPRATVQSAAVSIALPNNQVRESFSFFVYSVYTKHMDVEETRKKDLKMR